MRDGAYQREKNPACSDLERDGGHLQKDRNERECDRVRGGAYPRERNREQCDLLAHWAGRFGGEAAAELEKRIEAERARRKVSQPR